jgi:hypothetical protein
MKLLKEELHSVIILLLVKYYQLYEIKEDIMRKKCRTNGKTQTHKMLVGTAGGGRALWVHRRRWEDNIKVFSREIKIKFWSGFVWLSIKPVGELGNSWGSEKLLTTQQGLCSMELVIIRMNSTQLALQDRVYRRPLLNTGMCFSFHGLGGGGDEQIDLAVTLYTYVSHVLGYVFNRYTGYSE